jgi:serine/threonine protein kinase
MLAGVNHGNLDDEGSSGRPEQKDTLPGEYLVGQVLDDRYRIVEMLGCGAVGKVYRAEDLAESRSVAVKVINEQVRSGSHADSRFQREGRALDKLSHPNIVDVFGYGVADGIAYLAMELVEGDTLEEMLAGRQPLDYRLAVDAARQMLDALAYAHQSQVVHRDLKPGNVVLQRQQDGSCRVKLLDFGLAKFLAPDDLGVGQTLTKTGMVVGTPLYMSPEQAVGAKVDVRVDVYAAGSVIFEMFTGRPPFVVDTHQELVKAHLLAPVPRLADVIEGPAATRAMQTFIERAMAKEPESRFQDAGAMLEALEQALEQGALEPGVDPSGSTRLKKRPPSRARQRLPLILTAVLATGLLLAFGGLAIMGGRDQSAASPETDDRPAGGPWREGVPEGLARLHGKVSRGEIIGVEDVKQAQAYARENRGDPRPFLLLGRGFAQQRWRKDAITRYLRAYAVDPAARGDPRMLEDLLSFTGSDTYGDAACDAIEKIFDRKAAHAVNAALNRAPADSDHRKRLALLLEALSR